MNFEELIIRNPRGKCLARPGVSFTFYCDESLHTLSPRVAQALNVFSSWVGDNTLQTFFNSEGFARPLSASQRARDLANLQQVPDQQHAIIIEYSSDVEGWVGDFGFSYHGADFSHYLYEDNRANYLRLDFPANAISLFGMDELLALFSEIAQILSANFANGGFTFQRSSATQGDSTRKINRFLPRFVGFDPGYKDVMDDMRGRTFTAHWVNYIGGNLIAGMGGQSHILQVLKDAECRQAGQGVFIRGCRFPPVGDINRQARDIGQIPAVSRLLQQRRADITAFGEPTGKFDGSAWMARLDSLPCQPWDNETFYHELKV